jgi:hypothetical protein
MRRNKKMPTIFGDELVIICVPKEMVENNILLSGDGLENRMIAKDLLYKFEAWLIANGYRGFNLKKRLLGYDQNPISWTTERRFKEFLGTIE